MLIQFAVENFLSFKGKAVFSMIASDDHRHPSQVCTLPDGLRLVRCATLYGANASGKSNLVKALRFAQTLVAEGTRPGQRIAVKPFKLPLDSSKAARFEFEIWIEHCRYSYGFSVTPTAVVEEWLYRTEGGKEKMCFERQAPETDDSGKVSIRLGDIFGAESARVEFVAEGTRPEQLFLTEAEERNVTELKILSSWFRDRLRIITPNSSMSILARNAERYPEFLSFLAGYLQSAGTGITGLTTRRRSAEWLPELLRNQLLESLKEPTDVAISPDFDGVVVRGKEEGSLEQVRLITQRSLGEGAPVEFEIKEESDGTRRLLDLIPALFFLHSAKIDMHPIFVIDELERSLHPLLTRRFLADYLSMNCASGQMILTTHDTNLQDLELLRADEIWFVEKNISHASHLYSLAEFKPEQLQHLGSQLENGYLNGRFGAIPFFGKPQQLGLSTPG